MYTARQIKHGRHVRLSQGMTGFRLYKDGRLVDSFLRKGSIRKVYPGIKITMV